MYQYLQLEDLSRQCDAVSMHDTQVHPKCDSILSSDRQTRGNLIVLDFCGEPTVLDQISSLLVP